MIRCTELLVLALIGLALFGLAVQPTFGADVPVAPTPVDESVTTLPNVRTPTLGGMQFWADQLHFHGWRIQRQALTNHHRLLDADDRRHAWGSFEACRQRLEEIKQERDLRPMQGRAIILLHGLVRTRAMMKPLADYLDQETDSLVLRCGYPSTREGIDEHARSLANVISNLEGIDEIDFVAHSLGNIVIRRYLAVGWDADNQASPDPRIRRIVMLAPPNQGSKRGTLWDDNILTVGLYRTVLGDVGTELALDWPQTAGRLAIPACQFAVVAGGRGDADGWHDQLPGDDDGTVSVEETRLPSARDFLVVPVKHSAIPGDAGVMSYTLRFLQEGHFVAADRRAPIRDVDVARATRSTPSLTR